MAAHHPSPPAGMQLHHPPHNGPAPPGMAQQPPNWQPAAPPTSMQQLTAMNETVWLQIGKNHFFYPRFKPANVYDRKLSRTARQSR